MRPTAPLLIAVLAIVGAVIGYTMWGQHQKLQQERAVTALVADTTTQLRQALTAAPTREMFSRIDGNLRSLATLGRIVIIGIGAGGKAEFHLAALMGTRGSIRGSTLRARPLEEKAAAARAMERHVLPLFDTGALKVPIAETFPLEKAADAYDRFEAGGKLGKIVLTTRH